MYPTTHSPFERIKVFFSSRQPLPMLILVNLAVWISILLVSNFAFLFSSPEAGSDGSYKLHLTNAILNYFAIPANINVLLSKPWTLLTYMFLHTEFFHILFNMLWLYWFGVIFVQYLSQRQLLGTYIFGGIAGALLYVAAFNLFPVFDVARESALALGASASVLAIVVAISFYVPEYTIHLLLIGPVKIKYIAIFTVILDVFMISSANAGGHIAHLGGALWGFLWIKMIPGFDPTSIFEPLLNLSKPKTLRKPKRKFRVHHNDRPMNDDDYNRQKAEKQKRMDAILDKISRSGYDSLTREEKDLLFSNSNKK
ncbi:MAG: rhomboid family intramembrane serine protease [Lentimicrobium sp.]|jgi:membrane associated rhomboid family serine protease|nr:rhomboid family intramembrane serine protease [Lentimicrobium sp.]